MSKLFNPKNFPTKIFVVASLATFVFFGTFFLLVKSTINNNIDKKRNNTPPKHQNYLDSDGKLITKVPSLRDLIKSPIISDNDPSMGNADANIKIIVFSDFSCSYCAEQEKIIKKIIKKYPNKIQFIWKDYPESEIDSDSYQAALAARCAQEQGRFWPFHDLLFENKIDDYLLLAQKTDLDTKKFQKCLDGEDARKKIENNIIEANALEIKGIPFIYINDQEIMGEISLETMEKIIENQLN